MVSLPPVPIAHDTPVMVIDDDKVLERLLAEALYMEGYQVMPMVIPHTGAAVMSKIVVRALLQADRPTIILADPMSFGTPDTEALTAYLQDETRRHPHLLYLMTGFAGADAARAMTWLHADGLIAMPIDFNALLALISEAERILRERADTPPNPFRIDS